MGPGATWHGFLSTYFSHKSEHSECGSGPASFVGVHRVHLTHCHTTENGGCVWTAFTSVMHGDQHSICTRNWPFVRGMHPVVNCSDVAKWVAIKVKTVHCVGENSRGNQHGESAKLDLCTHIYAE